MRERVQRIARVAASDAYVFERVMELARLEAEVGMGGSGPRGGSIDDALAGQARTARAAQRMDVLSDEIARRVAVGGEDRDLLGQWLPGNGGAIVDAMHAMRSTITRRIAIMAVATIAAFGVTFAVARAAGVSQWWSLLIGFFAVGMVGALLMGRLSRPL